MRTRNAQPSFPSNSSAWLTEVAIQTMKAAPPISRSTAGGNVAVTQEGERRELSAIAGGVRGRFLLEPPNRATRSRPESCVPNPSDREKSIIGGSRRPPANLKSQSETAVPPSFGRSPGMAHRASGIGGRTVPDIGPAWYRPACRKWWRSDSALPIPTRSAILWAGSRPVSSSSLARSMRSRTIQA